VPGFKGLIEKQGFYRRKEYTVVDSAILKLKHEEIINRLDQIIKLLTEIAYPSHITITDESIRQGFDKFCDSHYNYTYKYSEYLGGV